MGVTLALTLYHQFLKTLFFTHSFTFCKIHIYAYFVEFHYVKSGLLACFCFLIRVIFYYFMVFAVYLFCLFSYYPFNNIFYFLVRIGVFFISLSYLLYNLRERLYIDRSNCDDDRITSPVIK